ncbi:nuclear RNA export factor 1 isoform X2 [Procambarus clarkii]|uniref:nuclear RNA export factor 1 isoform X2 n=1 Tax=Procambarus clarkii TaxID=6728 RepID=UPI00374228AE
MGGRGNNRYPPRDFPTQTKPDGSRQYYEHDDRGSYKSNSNSGGGSGSRAYTRDGYRTTTKIRGIRVWEADYDRGSRLPEGHWRGDRRGSGRMFRNQPRVPRLQGDDVDMHSNRGRNRRQDMYKGRGGRRGKDFKNNRSQHNGNNSSLGWHKILIRDGGNANKDEVLESIRNLVHEPFTPILFEAEGKNLVFYLEDNGRAAQAIVQTSRRITLPSGVRISLMSNRSPPPNRPVAANQHDSLKRIMSDRYSPELKRLTLKNFHNDANLIKEGIFCPLYRQPNLQLVVDIIVENIPQVEEIDLSHNKINNLDALGCVVTSCPNLQKLDLGKNKLLNMDSLNQLAGLNLTELTLEGNPLCDKFRETEVYISAVRKLFNKVLYLDGQELPKPIGFEVDEDDSKIPKSVPAYFVLPDVKDLVLQFIEQYYQIFDTEDRKPLEAAYSKNALFSLTCHFPDTGPGARLSNLYISDNRNLKKVFASDQRHKLVFQGRSTIGCVLRQLPSTVHDPPSFTLDVPVADPKLIVVTLSGVFRQHADRNPPIRSFTRTLTIIPEGTGFCICNEQLFITRATIDQVKRAFKTPIVPVENIQPVPENVPVPQQDTLVPLQEAMILKFSEASGMLPQFSQVCLEQNAWDFNKAGEIFTKLKAENKIPPEYFAQSL